jgi:hypothetical protein
MAQLAVGVGPGSRPATRGGLGRYASLYVDGMNTTDVTTGGITSPMNFDAVENFEIITGGMDAQYNSMGVVTNIVSKTGSNRYTVDANLTLSPKWATVKNAFPANNPGYVGNYVTSPVPLPEKAFYSPVLNQGGPIIQDKLWFFSSYQQNFFTGDTPVSILGNNYNRPNASTLTLGRFKLTWQATEKDRVSMAFNIDRNVINNNVAFGGNGSGVTDDAEQRIERGGQFFIVNYDHNFTDNVLFQLQTGVTYKNEKFDPVHGDFVTPPHTDTAGGPTQVNMSFPWNHDEKWRLQFDPSISWKLKGGGTHQMKAGLQYSWLIDQQISGVPGQIRYNDKNTTIGKICDPSNPATFQYCNQRFQYDPDLTTTAHVSDIGAFIQDRWNVNRQLTLVPGFRLDVGKLYGNTGFLTNLVGLGPRISATYDLFADRKSLIVAHYGRSNDVGNTFIPQHLNPSLTQYRGTFSAGAFPDCINNFNPALCLVSGGANGRTLASGQTPPHVDEIAIGYHQEPIEQSMLGIDLNFRRYSNLWADVETNRIYDATGTRVIGGRDGTTNSVLEGRTPASAYRDYKAIDLWFQGTPGKWDILASYTLAFATGTVADYFDGYMTNPRFDQFYDGPIPDDRRHTLKASVSYRMGYGVTLGSVVTYRTGTPLWERFMPPGDSPTSRYRSPRGTGFPINTASNTPDFNDPSNWVNLRNPDFINLGILARYNLGQALGLKEQKAEITCYIVNANDTSEPFGFDGRFSTTASRNQFGYSTGRTSALQGEVILRFRN